MKKLALAIILGVASWATDYSVMTFEQLQAMRGSIPQEDKAAFQAEVQNRISAMNQEEREAAKAFMRQSKSGPADGTGSQMRMGSGMNGAMNGGGMGARVGSGMGTSQYRGGK
ncbi:MAG: hypothetical protein JXQ67_06320 [Campylobacterales bacterium]|nr:hypothetical protein [Campylobacterales bacterium]